jgi:hypothetical protein
MKKTHGWRSGTVLGLGLLLAGLTGCQTWTYSSGMTLPTGHYLQHRPQYIPPSPDYPLERELAYMQQQQQVGPGAGGAVPPAPVVPGGAGGQ